MYDLDVNRVIEAIKANSHKKVLIQLPDGLKPRAKEIANEIESKCDAIVLIWFSSCYGACDIPADVDKLCDLFVQWGHNEFVKEWD